MARSYRFPLATALRESLRQGYSLAMFRHDLLAAFIVSLVALPLSMALAIAVGLPPQHGVYTAVVAGIITPLLGGSRFQVSGPTAAFVVVLAPIVADLGLRGIIWCQLLAGVMLILFALMRFGRLINYVPYPVTTGFTAGIAVVLATQSLNDLLGLGIEHLQGSYLEKLSMLLHALPSWHWPEAMVGLTCLVGMMFGGEITKRVPSPLLGITVSTLLALYLGSHGYHIETIGSRFSYVGAGGVAHLGIPPYLPALHWPTTHADSLFTWPSIEEFRVLLGPALTIAILAALESLLSATVADGLAGTRHHPNGELYAIGVGNVCSALASGIPATGAIARTAANIGAGARTPLAAVMHALFIMAYVLVLSRYINLVPMSALAGLLIYVAYRMSHIRQFVQAFEVAPRSDSAVMVACFLLTVLVDMVVGVSVGMVLAAMLLIKRITELTHVELETPAPGLDAQDEDNRSVLPAGVVVYHIRGPLFFGTVEKAFGRANFMKEGMHTLVVDMEHVSFIDMTGMVALHSMLKTIAAKDRRVVLCALGAIAERIRVHIAPMPEAAFVQIEPSLEKALQGLQK